jgi:hypothetical protein
MPGYKVRRVVGVRPERFVIVAIDSGFPEGSVVAMSDGLTEGELRARLTKDFGRPESEFDSLVQEARENPPVDLAVAK